MTRHGRVRLIAVMALAVIRLCAARAFAGDGQVTPEARAIAFLAKEVPKWKGENKCFSCHNNGDAARALAAAAATGQWPDRKPLAETLVFLSSPSDWDADGPDGPFKDKKLARIQFAAALADAQRAGILNRQAALGQAAQLVAELQSPDGYWQTDAPGTLGSPVTYGRALATAMALRTLETNGENRYAASVTTAQRWFIRTEAKSVLDAASALWALSDATGDDAAERREQCLSLIGKGRSSDGGWGPFVNSPPEVFDTALVVLALAATRDRERHREWLAGGRQFLISAQEADGGWPPTTRPPGVDSYAQRMSTIGWATQALLATRPK
jgi:hypothetical protein